MIFQQGHSANYVSEDTLLRRAKRVGSFLLDQLLSRRLAVLSIAILVLLSSRAVLCAAEVVDRIVAVVNGQLITLFELDEKFEPLLKKISSREPIPPDNAQITELKKKILSMMVDDILLEKEAERYEIKVTPMDIQNQIKQIREQHSLSEEQFANQLQLEGLSTHEYEEMVRRDILKNRLLGYMVHRKVVVTKEEIGQYYENHKSEFVYSEKLHLQLIVLPPGKDARQLRDQIVKGTLSFADAAQKYSVGPIAENGGDIGLLRREELAAGWRDAVQGLAVGEVSQPFVLDGKEALLRVADVKPGDNKPLSAVEGQIQKKLEGPKVEERFEEYMRKLREKAVIDIRL